MKISRIMSTQHPDNVNTPFFAEKPIIAGDDEIKEAFYAFSHLGIDEQLWDAEGKEVDTFVVKKLLTRYEDYFRSHTLGKDKFLRELCKISSSIKPLNENLFLFL